MIEALHFKGTWTLLDLAARVVVAESLPKGDEANLTRSLVSSVIPQENFHRSCAAS